MAQSTYNERQRRIYYTRDVGHRGGKNDINKKEQEYFIYTEYKVRYMTDRRLLKKKKKKKKFSV